jgi:hypothetical protein
VTAARTNEIPTVRASRPEKVAVPGTRAYVLADPTPKPDWEQYLPLTLEGPDRDELAELAVDILQHAQRAALDRGCRLADFGGHQRRLPPGGGR